MPDTWPGSKAFYYGHAGWAVVLGALLISMPAWCFGPTWSYFSQHGQPLFPAGGFGLGVCAAGIGVAQIAAIHYNRVRATIRLLFLGGFVQWTAGIIFAAEGLMGHQGLIEALYMVTIGGLKFISCTKLSIDYRRFKDQQ